MSLLCLAHHAVRLWRSPRRWPRGATNPVQKSHVSFPLSLGTWPCSRLKSKKLKKCVLNENCSGSLDWASPICAQRSFTRVLRVPNEPFRRLGTKKVDFCREIFGLCWLHQNFCKKIWDWIDSNQYFKTRFRCQWARAGSIIFLSFSFLFPLFFPPFQFSWLNPNLEENGIRLSRLIPNFAKVYSGWS